MGDPRTGLATGFGILGGLLSVALAEEARQAPAGLAGAPVPEVVPIVALVLAFCGGVASLLLLWRPREAGHALTLIAALYTVGMILALGVSPWEGPWYEAVGRVAYGATLLLAPLLLLGSAAYLGVTFPTGASGPRLKRSS